MIDATQTAIAVCALAPMVAGVVLGVAHFIRARARRQRNEADVRARLLKLAARVDFTIDPTWTLSELAFHVHNAVIADKMKIGVDQVLRQLRTVGDGDG